MEISDFIINLIILFIPGIIATMIINSLVERKNMENREFLVSSLLLGFLSYLILYVLNLLFTNAYHPCEPTNWNHTISFFRSLQNQTVDFNWLELLWASIISIFIGILVTRFINKGSLYTLAGKKHLDISNKFAESDVWGCLFYNSNDGFKSYVAIQLLDKDLIYFGWVDAQSADPEQREILLSKVSVFTKENGKWEESYSIDRKYIHFKNENVIIDILEKGQDMNYFVQAINPKGAVNTTGKNPNKPPVAKPPKPTKDTKRKDK